MSVPLSLSLCTCKRSSDCRMRRNVHFVVPKDKLELVDESGWSRLAEYRWGTGASRHLFCARCGITPFYVPRSNPDGWGVSFQCIAGGTISSVEVKRFDGLNWEECYAGQGAEIKKFSAVSEPTVPKSADPTPQALRPRSRAPRKPVPTGWLQSLLEVLFTMVLPVCLVLATLYTSSKMPGKPGDDTRLHFLAK